MRDFHFLCCAGSQCSDFYNEVVLLLLLQKKKKDAISIGARSSALVVVSGLPDQMENRSRSFMSEEPTVLQNSK